ncbi:hypothetical protein DKM44_12355 [Deinococcus irradiatisoli]|uniref:Uncharacterized protein n=1 Tax=Deinococcus irradiatisoli TaxID=2202254 RepID=A0A2Z3JI96_9DEIO|nr:hypothetical protein [Deinococcus irradiatisoli]AWN24665.1 hypothetical protein DKM44_12355 [Deinococcus irradiatisoli]
MVQHYTDTRTAEGRVRFLLDGPDVLLSTEGHGWQRSERFGSFQDAALALALDLRIPQALYVQALEELYHQLHFFGQPGAA